MASSYAQSLEAAAAIGLLQKSALTERLASAALPANTSLSHGTTNKKLQPDRLRCNCCLRRYISKSHSSPDDRSRSDGSRRYFRQFVLNTSSDEELEMTLQEETEQLQGLELLIQDMQNGPEEHAAGLLAKLRTGLSISQHIQRYVDEQSQITDS